jgi:hypothetical protein
MGFFSLPTTTALIEVITGGAGNQDTQPIGIYRSGNTLQMFFGSVGLELQIGMQGRVPATRSLLNEVNDSDDALERLRPVFELVADPREYTRAPERHGAVLEVLNTNLRSDGYELRRVDERFRLVALGANAPVAAALVEAARLLNLESVSRDFERALTQADIDPEDAITSACSTVESVCKCLLDEMHHPYPAVQDISGLVREVQRHLDLSPGQPNIQQDLRQMLSGLISVAGGIGALRTHTGDAHGRGIGAVQPTPRIARLAIHTASTLALFLIETWQQRDQ